MVLKRESSAGLYQAALEVEGSDLEPLHNEAGGHRIQRVPPTERRGRVQTSTVTVAVLACQEKADVHIKDSDFEVEWFSGSGKGGQHRNKHQNSCRLKHVPTGMIETRQGRQRENNLREARLALQQRLNDFYQQSAQKVVDKSRKDQVGSGMRGDKTVTLRFQADTAHCHLNNKSMSAVRYMRGYMDEIW